VNLTLLTLLALAALCSAAVAEVALQIPISSMGNPWWIMMDAKFMEGHIGAYTRRQSREGLLIPAAGLIACPWLCINDSGPQATRGI
jgi:hypothetical protein